MSLEIIKKLLIHGSLSSRIQRTRIKGKVSTNLQQEASFCIQIKGSLTVEAAVVIPLMMGFLVSLLFLFRVLLVQTAVEEALLFAGRAVAVESCLFDSETALYVSAEALLKASLMEDKNVERYVVGGVLGVSLLGSEFTGEEIELTANYLVKFPIDFWGEQGLWLTSKNQFAKWMGDLYAGNEEEEWVYITETGSVYHKDTSCRSLDLSIQEGDISEISQLRGSNGQKYNPCGRCLVVQSNNGTVYYTDYGRLYHGDLACSALKRTISRVLLSEVGNRPPCSFCY